MLGPWGTQPSCQLGAQPRSLREGSELSRGQGCRILVVLPSRGPLNISPGYHAVLSREVLSAMRHTFATHPRTGTIKGAPPPMQHNGRSRRTPHIGPHACHKTVCARVQTYQQDRALASRVRACWTYLNDPSARPQTEEKYAFVEAATVAVAGYQILATRSWLPDPG